MIDLIEWLGYSSFAIHTTPSIYINPWRIVKTNRSADIILISSAEHHCLAPADIAKLRGPHTLIIGPESVAHAASLTDVHVLRPWQTITVGRVGIKAIPASIDDEGAAVGLGFVISHNYYDLYYAGSAGLIPQLSALQPDIAILPIDGAPLTTNEAAEAAALLRPRQVIPCNWGAGAGLAGLYDAQQFAQLVNERAPSTQVVLLNN